MGDLYVVLPIPTAKKPQTNGIPRRMVLLQAANGN